MFLHVYHLNFGQKNCQNVNSNQNDVIFRSKIVKLILIQQKCLNPFMKKSNMCSDLVKLNAQLFRNSKATPPIPTMNKSLEVPERKVLQDFQLYSYT